MRRLVLLAGAVSAMLALSLLPGAAKAQQVLSFVSGAGDDINPCTRASPCQTWAGAQSKTAAGGEIDALDAGPFGLATTITQAITLDGAGQAALTLAPSGLNGITINAGAGDVVTLRNLRINGLAQTNIPGLNGILIEQAGVVHIENCYVFGFSKNGIVAKNAAQTKLVLDDTTISDSLNGIQLGPTGGTYFATFERVRVHNNSNAGVFLNPSGSSVIFLGMSRSNVTVNGTGLLVEPNGVVALNDNQISRNSIAGVTVIGDGLVSSFGNNAIIDPTTGTPFSNTPLK